MTERLRGKSELKGALIQRTSSSIVSKVDELLQLFMVSKKFSMKQFSLCKKGSNFMNNKENMLFFCPGYLQIKRNSMNQ